MVSPQTRQQLHRVHDPVGMLLLLKLEHPSIATAYVVNDTRDWVISGTTYVGLPFRFKLPDSAAGQAPRATIELDNVGRELSQELEALPPGGALLATFSLVSRVQPTIVDYQFTAPMTGVSVDIGTVTAVLGNDDAMRAPAVKMRYDLQTSPGLFPG